MAKPILTLTTDFGLTDHFVGVMKGVILDICPQAQIVDISHEVAPFAIAEGAYLIAQAYPYFSKDSVHIVSSTRAWEPPAGPSWWKPRDSILSRQTTGFWK